MVLLHFLSILRAIEISPWNCEDPSPKDGSIGVSAFEHFNYVCNKLHSVCGGAIYNCGSRRNVLYSR